MRRYQSGCLYREVRKSGLDVWVFRFRDSTGHNKKEIIGDVTKYPKKTDAERACQSRRAVINVTAHAPRTLSELAAHYTEIELPRKTPYTREVYSGYLNTWILPKWGQSMLSDVKPTAVESWLGSLLSLANGTRAKLRNLMHALYTHGMRHEFTVSNPISLVRQSAKRTREPEVLAPKEIGKLLTELADPWRTAVYTALCTGLRVSELLALRWEDLNIAAGEIRLARGIVRQHIGNMKSEASRKPVPLDARLSAVLESWRSRCGYPAESDYVFASPDKDGKQPYWPTSGMEKHIRPAAQRAGITKRIGWHMFRHTFGTLVDASGAHVSTTQGLMRHANVSITMDCYVQAVSKSKRTAQSRLMRSVPFPSVPTARTERLQ
jgi:integrase